MSEPEPTVNWQQALEDVEGDERLLGELSQAFLQEAPCTLEEIRQSIDDCWRAARTLTISAHRLKGSLRFFGAPVASELALSLELLGHQAVEFLGTERVPVKGRQKLAELEQQVARVQECLRERFGAVTPEPPKE